MSRNSIIPVESRVAPTQKKSGNVAQEGQSSLNSTSSSTKVEKLCFPPYIQDSTETQTTPRPITS